MKIKKILSYSVLSIVLIVIGGMIYIRFFLPDVSAAPSIEIPRTSASIENGEYLANHVAVCMDCHSTRDWSKYSAPLVAGTLGKGGEYFGPEMGFPGKFYARNLTPAHLESWTDGEIYRAITTGVNKNGEALFPVMPYKYYGKMSKQDVYDIIAYLRTLEPIENDIPQHEVDFPMNFILNTIPSEAETVKKPSRSDKLAYGQYLTNAAGCIECHTQADKGNIITSLAFAGGREFAMPGGIVRSANITPDEETGIGSWSEEMFLQRFKSYEDIQKLASVSETEVNTVMPWSMYTGMEEKDLKAIYAYLQSLKPLKNEVEKFPQS